MELCVNTEVNDQYHSELVGRPIKRQRQPLAGGVIKVEMMLRFLFAYFCEVSSINTACGNSVSLHRRYKART